MRTAIEIERLVSGVYLKIAVGCFSFTQIDNPAAIQINLECRGVAKGGCFVLVAEFSCRKSAVIDSETGHFESRGLFSRKLSVPPLSILGRMKFSTFPAKGP